MIIALFAVALTSCNNEDKDKLQIIEFECIYEVRHLERELLVFILRGYFELTTEQRGGSCVRICKITSERLRETIESFNLISISRAFPDWSDEPEIVYNESGIPVQRPDFSRVFIFLFASEQDIDEAMEKLNDFYLYEVLYAERHSNATLGEVGKQEYLHGNNNELSP